MNTNKTRELVEGALMCAIVGMFVVLDRQLAGIFSSFIFLIPLPMVYISFKYELKTALITYFGCVVLSFIFGMLPMVILVAIEGIIGLFYGNGLKKNESSTSLVIKTMIMAIVTNFITTVLFASFFGYDIVGEANQSVSVIEATFKQFNVPLEGIDLRGYIRVAILASIVLTGVMEGYLTHVTSRLLLSRLKLKIAKPTPVFLYKPNVISGYVAFALFVGFWYIFTSKIDNQTIVFIGSFLGLLGYFYLVAFGCIGSITWMKAYLNANNLLSVFIVMSSVLFLSFALMVLGFLYITTDMRDKAVERIINDSQNRSS